MPLSDSFCLIKMYDVVLGTELGSLAPSTGGMANGTIIGFTYASIDLSMIQCL